MIFLARTIHENVVKKKAQDGKLVMSLMSPEIIFVSVFGPYKNLRIPNIEV